MGTPRGWPRRVSVGPCTGWGPTPGQAVPCKTHGWYRKYPWWHGGALQQCQAPKLCQELGFSPCNLAEKFQKRQKNSCSPLKNSSQTPRPETSCADGFFSSLKVFWVKFGQVCAHPSPVLGDREETPHPVVSGYVEKGMLRWVSPRLSSSLTMLREKGTLKAWGGWTWNPM